MRNGAKQQNPYIISLKKYLKYLITDYRITNIKMILKKKRLFFLPERAVVSDIFWYETANTKIVHSSYHKHPADWGPCSDWLVRSQSPAPRTLPPAQTYCGRNGKCSSVSSTLSFSLGNQWGDRELPSPSALSSVSSLCVVRSGRGWYDNRHRLYHHCAVYRLWPLSVHSSRFAWAFPVKCLSCHQWCSISSDVVLPPHQISRFPVTSYTSMY